MSMTILPSIMNLKVWMDDVGLKSGDPFALQCSDFGVYTSKLLPRYITGACYILDRKFPTVMHTIFKHTVAPQSVGLYLQACELMYKCTYNPEWIKYECKWVNWLKENANRKYTGYTWGIPFKWLMGTGVLAPENTPMSTVTPYCSDAFYLLQNPKIATSNADFIMTDLKKTYQDDEKACLSYSPLDNFMIINVQAYCAAQLYRAYKYTGYTPYTQLADKLINFVLDEQNEDGSWYYWSKKTTEPVPTSIDSLHQCYIMQGLYRSYMVNQNTKIKDAVLKCMEYCNDNLITNRHEVKKFADKKQPYELIDAAEIVSTLDLIGEHEFATLVLFATIPKFSTPAPYFASWNKPRNNIPYIRWGQSQMLFAMAQNTALNSKRVTLQEIYL